MILTVCQPTPCVHEKAIDQCWRNANTALPLIGFLMDILRTRQLLLTIDKGAATTFSQVRLKELSLRAPRSYASIEPPTENYRLKIHKSK